MYEQVQGHLREADGLTQRPRLRHNYFGNMVCRKAWLQLWGISQDMLLRMRMHARDGHVEPPEDMRKNAGPTNCPCLGTTQPTQPTQGGVGVGVNSGYS